MLRNTRRAALSGAALILVSAALGGGANAQQADRNPQGMALDRMERIAPAMKAEVAKGTFPGAVTMIARDGRIVHFEAHGFMDQTKARPMQKNGLFMLASMTKPLTSVVAMQLVEEGLIKLNDPISRWLTELKDVQVEVRRTGADGQPMTELVAPTRPITVQDLLRHTSGLTYAGSSPSTRIREDYVRDNIEGRVANISASQMLEKLGKIPLAHQPGTAFEYSISTDVLGLLIQRVLRKPLDHVFEERITGPLGMRDTTWWVPPAKRSRLAEAFDTDPQKKGAWDAYRILEDNAGKQYFRGGAGLVSTAEDYLKFAQMILNKGELNGRRLLSAKTVDFMLSNHLVGMGGTTAATTGPGYGFGLGFAVRLQDGFGFAPGSTGDAMWAGAWGTSFWIDPKEKLVGILMAQDLSNRFQTRMLFKNLVYGAMVRTR